MTNLNFKITHRFKGSNSAGALNAGVYIVAEDQVNAQKSDNLPHNSAIFTNTDTACKVGIWFDNFSDSNHPDFIVFPSQQVVVPVEDGYSFSTVFIKNLDAVNNIAQYGIKYSIMTVREVEKPFSDKARGGF